MDDEGNEEHTYWLGVTDNEGNVVLGVHSMWNLSNSINLRELFKNAGVEYGDYNLYYSVYKNIGGWSVFISDSSSEIKWHYGKDLSGAEVTGITDTTYTGSEITQSLTIRLEGVILIEGTDYTISYEDNTDIGTAKVIITGIGNYAGTVEKTFEITPADEPETTTGTNKDKTVTKADSKAVNPLTVKGKTVKIKYSRLKKKSLKIKRAKAIMVKNAQGKVTYKKISVNKKKYAKKFIVNVKTGKIKVKKGVKKGTYKVKVKVRAAGNANYNSATKTVTVKIKVK